MESHIGECQPCCETLLGLSEADTFVGLLQQSERPDDPSMAADVQTVPDKHLVRKSQLNGPLTDILAIELLTELREVEWGTYTKQNT